MTSAPDSLSKPQSEKLLINKPPSGKPFMSSLNAAINKSKPNANARRNLGNIKYLITLLAPPLVKDPN